MLHRFSNSFAGPSRVGVGSAWKIGPLLVTGCFLGEEGSARPAGVVEVWVEGTGSFAVGWAVALAAFGAELKAIDGVLTQVFGYLNWLIVN